MDSDIFSLGETWLEKDDIVEFDNYTSYLANFGNGKGVAGYTKLELIGPPETVSSQTYSAIFIKTRCFHIIFLYLSRDVYIVFTISKRTFLILAFWFDIEIVFYPRLMKRSRMMKFFFLLLVTPNFFATCKEIGKFKLDDLIQCLIYFVQYIHH